MTPTEKHRETAKDIAFDFDCDWTADGRRRGEAEYHAAIEAITAALAKAEREGMKRAAEIASRDADWSRFGKREVHEPWEGGPDDARDYRIGIVAGRAIAAAILSEAGESE